MSESRVTNALVAQFRRGRVPVELRLMGAQGALPLKPEDLLELLVDLTSDPEPMVVDAARNSLRDFPASETLPIAKSRETPVAVLAWILTHRPERELREGCLQNPSLPDEVIESLAPGLSQELAELVVINQTRLLRRTSLLEAIESNASLSNDQRRRLRELRETFRVGAAVAPESIQAPAPAAEAPVEAEAEPEAQELPEGEEGDVSEADALVRYLTDEERRQAEKVSAVQKIYRLTTAEKVITALKGTREERAILVRDPNRIVNTAVLGSPRMTETEVESFAAMKNVSQDVLRQIGTHREWVKRYGVIQALVKNPRVPVGIAMSLVARLNPRDMKAVMVDRNVPEVIRRQAQKFVKAVNEGPRR